MRTSTLVFVLALVCTVGVPAHVRAQAPAASSAAMPAPAASEGGVAARRAYDADGRRDPFISLAQSGTALTPGSGRPTGVRGLLISELTLKGIVQSGQRRLASVQGPDKRTFTVANGDELFDGSVKVITAADVVFLQRVDDPLSPITQREIRKTLRSTEENR